MQKRTNHALLISFGLHIMLMLAVSPFLINRINTEERKVYQLRY